MAKINSDEKILTLINTFDVDKDKQQLLMGLLVSATTGVMTKLDGFISANLHMSIDKRYIVNYAQWKSKAHFEAMLENPEVQMHMRKAREITKSITPVLCEVIYCESASI
ncbi:hypothetical protein B0W48_02435 [Pseudoalteromonas aliena]|uniref:ABM domain-containing protein n=1 Tax=Pseudoalteromonas aliena TaxID=247523 RepID=A0A1Q2GUK7_9GAMM|nr:MULTISPECIES: antibiotic biosynthesis monooxygenase [Pseudoalteromonas]AQP98757.1 hypothetical protein B0W48_02435 [Pseudoalteromonas aliena]MBB1404667.1 antibiotic biosynthesis monooxygenase [Pseudoalteromonas sp. SG44-5]